MCGIYVALIEFFQFSYFRSSQLTSINLAPTLARGVFYATVKTEDAYEMPIPMGIFYVL